MFSKTRVALRSGDFNERIVVYVVLDDLLGFEFEHLDTTRTTWTGPRREGAENVGGLMTFGPPFGTNVKPPTDRNLRGLYTVTLRLLKDRTLRTYSSNSQIISRVPFVFCCLIARTRTWRR